MWKPENSNTPFLDLLIECGEQIPDQSSGRDLYVGYPQPCVCRWRPVWVHAASASCVCVLCLPPECAWCQPAGHVVYLTQNRTPLMFQRMEPSEGGGTDGQGGQGLNGLPSTQPDNIISVWVDGVGEYAHIDPTCGPWGQFIGGLNWRTNLLTLTRTKKDLDQTLVNYLLTKYCRWWGRVIYFS